MHLCRPSCHRRRRGARRRSRLQGASRASARRPSPCACSPAAEPAKCAACCRFSARRCCMLKEKYPDLRIVIPVVHAVAETVKDLTRDWPCRWSSSSTWRSALTPSPPRRRHGQIGHRDARACARQCPDGGRLPDQPDIGLPRPPHGGKRRARLAGEPARRARGGAGTSSRRNARPSFSRRPSTRFSAQSKSAPSSAKPSRRSSRRSATAPRRQASAPPRLCSISSAASRPRRRRPCPARTNASLSARPRRRPNGPAALHPLQVLLDALVDHARDAQRLASGLAVHQGLGPVMMQSRKASISLARLSCFSIS